MHAKCYDLLGIGFGPANLALAIALDEVLETDPTPTEMSARFVEADENPVWQGGMLLDGSNIQNNPIRDLVTLRNPRSRYSFINYLHQSGRLLEHLNLPGEFPLRKEYAQYIAWVRHHFDDLVDYGHRAVSIGVTEHDGVPVYEVLTQRGLRLLGRALVLGTGRAPHIPVPFDGVTDDRVFHAGDYLYRLADLTTEPGTVVIVGGSQSAVEVTLDLTRRYPAAQVHNYTRSFGLKLKDTSPFSEEAFSPGFTDYYVRASRLSKTVLDAYLRPTNYSSTDADVLHELYLQRYEQRLDGQQRVFVHNNRQIIDVATSARSVLLTVAEVHTGEREELETDLVVLATGFLDIGPGPGREPYPALLSGLSQRLRFDDAGYLAIDEGYRVLSKADDLPPLFLNGLCETTHGIGDAGSFSLLSLRAAVLCGRLRALTPQPHDVSAQSHAMGGRQ